MSLKLRILFTILSLVIGSLLVVSTATMIVSSNVSETALTQAAKEKLTSQAVNTKQAIETYFDLLESQIAIMSQKKDVISKAGDFIQAFNTYVSQRGQITGAERDKLASYYKNDFSERYNKRNGKPLGSIDPLFSGLSNTAYALQYDFIASSAYNIGEKDGLTDLGNESQYSALHKAFHPDTRRFLQEYGYYDVFIADATSGNIVYSVFKELDFATSLKTGPYANSGIGLAFKEALNIKQGSGVFTSTIAQYLPSYDAMAGFLSAPIYDNEKLVAVLIFQIPLDRINNVLTRERQWVQQGYGLSGETYLSNADNTLLTESRFFIEDKAAYLDIISQTMPKAAAAIEVADTSVGYQEVNTESAKAALTGKSGFSTILDYRNVEVFSAYMPVSFGSNTFALMAEIDVAEALEPASAIKIALIQAVVVVMIIVIAISTLAGIVLTKKTTQPLESVGKMCKNLSSGEGDLTIRLDKCGIAEIDQLLVAFNVFIAQVQDIMRVIKEDSAALASVSQQLLVITDSTSQTSSDQRGQTHSVASAMEELSASIAEISETVVKNKEQSDIAKHGLREHLGKTDIAAQNIRELVTLIKSSSDVIQSLKMEVNEVTNFLSVITSIADQTNLLALNAAIEAARAGEAGRGFSVVADEVRTLATRSQENTVEISKIIESMTSSSDKSVKSMDEAVIAADNGIDLVDTVTRALTELAGALEESQELAEIVSSATEEQTAASASVSASVNHISEMSHDVESGAKQSSDSANELERIATRTNKMVGRFKV